MIWGYPYFRKPPYVWKHLERSTNNWKKLKPQPHMMVGRSEFVCAIFSWDIWLKQWDLNQFGDNIFMKKTLICNGWFTHHDWRYIQDVSNNNREITLKSDGDVYPWQNQYNTHSHWPTIWAYPNGVLNHSRYEMAIQVHYRNSFMVSQMSGHLGMPHPKFHAQAIAPDAGFQCSPGWCLMHRHSAIFSTETAKDTMSNIAGFANHGTAI